MLLFYLFLSAQAAWTPDIPIVSSNTISGCHVAVVRWLRTTYGPVYRNMSKKDSAKFFEEILAAVTSINVRGNLNGNPPSTFIFECTLWPAPDVLVWNQVSFPWRVKFLLTCDPVFTRRYLNEAGTYGECTEPRDQTVPTGPRRLTNLEESVTAYLVGDSPTSRY